MPGKKIAEEGLQQYKAQREYLLWSSERIEGIQNSTPARIRFNNPGHGNKDERPELPPSWMCQLAQIWLTDQNSGRPPS